MSPLQVKMNPNLPLPTVEDVQRIKTIEDPVVRNLQITQCYHELSTVLARRSGSAANWCTFATWASKQAGQTIRKEDLRRLLERRLKRSPSTVQASIAVAAAVGATGGNQIMSPPDVMLRANHFLGALDQASDAVSRGNKKVFEEIGYEFARFYATCLPDEKTDEQKIARFCEALKPGEPPDGQGYLRQAFAHYYLALFEPDAKTRAELILLANIEIGFHEQRRLQPEISESLDAGMVSFLEFARRLFGSIFPWGGWFHLVHLYLRRLLGRPTALDVAIQTLLAEVGSQIRQAITELMMTISLPSGKSLRLGKDLDVGFPEILQQITNPQLRHLLDQHDPTPDSLTGSGAYDWADFPDRLHFIIDLFRCYQEERNLFEPPFTPEQVEALKNGKLPGGSL
jgi:hypothetical protein